jgi:hypothetical protein
MRNKKEMPRTALRYAIEKNDQRSKNESNGKISLFSLSIVFLVLNRYLPERENAARGCSKNIDYRHDRKRILLPIRFLNHIIFSPIAIITPYPNEGINPRSMMLFKIKLWICRDTISKFKK